MQGRCRLLLCLPCGSYLLCVCVLSDFVWVVMVASEANESILRRGEVVRTNKDEDDQRETEKGVEKSGKRRGTVSFFMRII